VDTKRATGVLIKWENFGAFFMLTSFAGKLVNQGYFKQLVL
jgi:hypothetical protein